MSPPPESYDNPQYILRYLNSLGELPERGKVRQGHTYSKISKATKISLTQIYKTLEILERRGSVRVEKRRVHLLDRLPRKVAAITDVGRSRIY